MATCKECVHNNICNITQIDYQPKNTIQHIEEYCGQFKDPSRLVYLPCMAGDTVYYIANVNGKDTINSAVVDEVTIYKSGTIGYDCGVGEIGFSSKSIGKRVFLTREEAEQALKERDRND